jgi:hypothetical protein
MMKSNGWMLPFHMKSAAMARDRITYMTEDRRAAWGIPADRYTEYRILYENAETLLPFFAFLTMGVVMKRYMKKPVLRPYAR